MGKKELFEVADRQMGYFTAQQAVACGIARSAFRFRLTSGEWEREGRGIYRLVQYPVSGERAELVYWSLWSRDKGGEPQGIWSHETALDIHGLSDLMPSKMFMTVPKGFRRTTDIPPVLQLHYAELSAVDIENRRGYRVTKPLRTILDVIKCGRVSTEHIVQALRDGLSQGILVRSDFAKLSASAAAAELQGLVNDYGL